MNDIQILPDGVMQAPTNQNKAKGSTDQSERMLACRWVACQFQPVEQVAKLKQSLLP